jgi:hypothetical protein
MHRQMCARHCSAKQAWCWQCATTWLVSTFAAAAAAASAAALCQSQVAVKVVDLSAAPPDVCQALQREASVVLAVSGECRHSCQYKGATIKGNRF